MTQLTEARAGRITSEMKIVAEKEEVSPEFIRDSVAKGTMVIPANINHGNLDPIGIGRGIRVKINSNIGTSPKDIDVAKELRKLEVSIEYGADTVMDLSTGGDLNAIRERIIAESRVPIGTVPIYQAMAEATTIDEVDGDAMIEAIRNHAEQGVDFVTVHSGVTESALPLIGKRRAGVVSRGGAFLVAWMRKNGRNSPLYERFDEIMEILAEFDVTISIGDGLRPGCLSDASDEAQYGELKIIGELTRRAWECGVQVIVEGPGHVPLHLIKENMEMQQKYCHGAPFYVLGPLVTDVAPGYDHITGAIGGALAAHYGASFLCYVTPAEHLKLPDVEDVIDGVIASRIAAHAADIANGIPGAMDWDNEISGARRRLDWDKQLQLAMNPARARKYRDMSKASHDECTMCGRFCAIKVFDEKESSEEESR